MDVGLVSTVHCETLQSVTQSVWRMTEAIRFNNRASTEGFGLELRRDHPNMTRSYFYLMFQVTR